MLYLVRLSRCASGRQLSDYTCTALQLANFWQDVAVDYGKGRIYLPLEDLAKYGVSEERHRRAPGHSAVSGDDEVRSRARPRLVSAGAAAGEDGRQASRRSTSNCSAAAGWRSSNAIERQGYDVLTRRPVISKPRKLWLVARAAVGKLL